MAVSACHDHYYHLCLLLLLIPFSLCLHSSTSTSTSHVHIAYLGDNHDQEPHLTAELHLQLLSNVFSNEDEAKEAMVYSYRHSFSGFAVMLNSTQATTLANMKGVISVFRSKTLKLHTTRSWDFMGLTLDRSVSEQIPLQLKYGSDVVVGVLDTGIWPESDSFKEDCSTGPVPQSWKGTCEAGEDFNPVKACNRKLVGARYYIAGYEREFGPLNTTGDAEYRSPRDRIGHGTHTASTAAGAIVHGASFFGFASGCARGGAPLACIAAYKVCWLGDSQPQCSEADILAAFDDSLRDGVSVISASLGASPPLMPLFATGMNIGSFHAAQRGVPVVFSAGNDGPETGMVQNVAPWGICVAAGTIDRSFPTKIILGNNLSFVGHGFILQQMKMKLIDSGALFVDGSCAYDKWNGRKLPPGRIVVCFSNTGDHITSLSAAVAVLLANGSGMIYVEPFTKLLAQDDFLPSVHVDFYQGTKILHYILSTRDPRVQIFPSKTSIGQIPAPTVAYFSSRGPSSLSPNILKPDIAAPGVNILAAWPPKAPPSMLPFDRRSINWNVDSGTSMSCPHVSGVVALIKSAHPNWSPAAIKSALMTTAYTDDTTADTVLAGGTVMPTNPFDIGSGHINPVRAVNPGLVYDIETEDYILFLCSIGYTEDQIRRLVTPSQSVQVKCESKHSDTDLNYPAIVVSNLRSTTTVERTLTNVGHNSVAVYFASVRSPQGVEIILWPRVLIFTKNVKKISYFVTMAPLKVSQGRYDFGEIVWVDLYHQVRTPLIVRVGKIVERERNDVNSYLY